MKVFYIDPQSYNNLSVYDYSLLSNVDGHEITYYYNDMYQCNAYPSEKKVCCFHYSSKSSGIAKALSYVGSILHIAKDVIVKRPDVVHVQWLRVWHLDYMLAKLLKVCGAKVIFTAHNILPHVSKANDEVQYKKYYKLVDEIIVHNSRTKQELIDIMGVAEDKINVIFHGVLDSTIEQADAEKRSEELKKELQIADGQMVFSCLGVQKPYKGTEYVIKTWVNTPVLYNNPKCYLIIAGRNHGIDYSPLDNCTNAFVLDAMLTDLDFEAYLQLSSVVLLPYIKISQSGLFFSAINRYTPSLVADVGGLTEPLLYGKVGWSMGELSLETLRDSMLRLLYHPEEVKGMKGNKAEYDAVRAVYSWKTIGKQTAQLYSCIK